MIQSGKRELQLQVCVRKKRRRKEKGWERWREGGRDGGRDGGREGGREGEIEGGRKKKRERGRMDKHKGVDSYNASLLCNNPHAPAQ